MGQDRIKQGVKAKRRSDEESLYHIVERDLFRDAIFPENDGYAPQVSLGIKNKKKSIRMDYVVKYGDKIFGIEVKQSFPTKDDFKQAIRYKKYLDGIFLAYPSDRVGEAMYLNEFNHKYPEVGLISIALFRTHHIRPCTFSKRKNDKLLDRFYIEDWNCLDYDKKLKRIAETVLSDAFWVSVDKSGKSIETDELKAIRLLRKDLESLAILYALTKAKGILRWFSWNELHKFGKKLNWKNPDYGLLRVACLAESCTYSDQNAFRLSNEALVNEHALKTAIEGKNTSQWKKLVKSWKEAKMEHLKEQNKNKGQIYTKTQ